MASTGITGANFKRVNRLQLETKGSGGVDYPLVSASFSWGVDMPTTCQVAPVVGERLLPKGGAAADLPTLENLPADELVDIRIEVDGDQTVVHTGYPIGNSITSASGALPNASMINRVIQINSQLSLLSTISPAQRVFFNGLTTPTAQKTSSELAVIQSDKGLVSYFYKKNLLQPNPAKYIITMLEDLNKAHAEAGSQAAEVIIPDILYTSEAYTLNDNITAAGRSNVSFKLAQKVSGRCTAAWYNSTTLQALTDYNSLAFLHTVPKDIEEGTYTLAPTNPLYKEYVREILPKETLSVQTRKLSGADLEPISQVWVARAVKGSDDSVATAVAGSVKTLDYHRWPIGIRKGKALIKPVPYLFDSLVDQQLVKGGTGNESQKVNQKGQKSEATEDLVKDKTREDPWSQFEVDTLGTQVARMYYVDRAFNQRNTTMTIPWHLYEEMIGYLGQNVAFQIPFETGKYIGYLTNVTLTVDRSSNSAVCSLNIASVRTEAENSELGFDDHPLYAAWLGTGDAE